VPPAPAEPATIAVGDLSIDEGDAGNAIAKVSITLDRPATQDHVLQYRVSGGSATPRVDFSAPASGVTTGTKTIKAGQTETFVQVTVLNDTVAEAANETVAIDLLSAPGLDIIRGHGDVTIVDDDGGAGAASSAPTLSVGAPTVLEGDSDVRTAFVPVSLSVPATEPITIVLDLDGTLPDEWESLSCEELNRLRIEPLTKTVTFNVGQQSKQVNVPVSGNVSTDELYTGVASTATLVSGTAIIDQPDPLLLVDDDNGDPPAAVAPPAGTYRVSELADGSDPEFPPAVSNPSVGCGGPESTSAVVSDDGRYVAFTSSADNLVGEDVNGAPDVFVKDTWTGAIEMVSVAADGTQANNTYSRNPSISGDGRYVTFSSTATNLVPDDDNGFPDEFLKDRLTGAVERLGNIHSFHRSSWMSMISSDNRSVVFISNEPVAGGCTTACGTQVYLYDVVTDAYSLVTDGQGIAFWSASNPSISGDGDHVAFLGWAVGTTTPQIYVKDLDSGDIEMVSVNNNGDPVDGQGVYSAARPAMSHDGQVVAFVGEHCNTGLPAWRCANADPGHYGHEVWVRDREAGTLTLGSVGPNDAPASWSMGEPSLSADGRSLAFTASDVTWVPGCPQSGGDSGGLNLWLRDLETGTTERINTDVDGDDCASAYSYSPRSMTPDAQSFVYASSHTGNPGVDDPITVYITKRS
jgi:Tol biopolymer transport system component